ncbi:hypothetical protein ACRYCC_04100 [Actinomadura scrupuli]|uniref:hypothetical protein n=1 Tax=Actinomadura scrupuli TaxID=559629 RepID=UPI003D995613
MGFLPARKNPAAPAAPVVARPTDENLPRPVSGQGHPHGRTSSWVLVGTVIAAFLVGGISLIMHAWTIMIICGVIIVLAVPVGAAIHIMSDTVGWTDAPPTYIDRGHVIREASRIYRREHSGDDPNMVA